MTDRTISRRILALMLVLVLAVSMAACQSAQSNQPATNVTEVTQQTDPQPESTQTEPSPTETEPPTEPAKNPDSPALAAFRKALEPSDAIGGIAFIATNPDKEDTAELYASLEERGYFSKYPFLLEVPENQAVIVGGQEVYCVVPADPGTYVKVERLDSNGIPTDVLYENSEGLPFWLICNQSDIMSNVRITMKNDFLELTDYSPSLDNFYGTVRLPEGDDPTLIDFTIYRNTASVSFMLYVPSSSSTWEMIPTQMVLADDNAIPQLFIEHRALPDTVEVNIFEINDDGTIELDLSESFAEYIASLPQEEAKLTVQCLVNSYVEAYRCDSVIITSAGEAVVNGDMDFSGALTFRELASGKG